MEQEEAEEYAEKRGRTEGIAYGEKKKQEEMIRMFSKINTPEQIAETLHVSKEYVLDVLKDDGSMVVAEPSHSYASCRKE